MYDIEPHHWMQRRINGKDKLGGACTSLFRAQDIHMDGHQDLMAIGDVFMSTHYTLFDRDTDMIGFAKAIHTTDEVMMQYD